MEELKRQFFQLLAGEDTAAAISQIRAMLDAEPELAGIPDIGGYYPLQLAAKRGSLLFTELLITYGSPIEAEDGEGRTALHWALQGRSERGGRSSLKSRC